MATRHNLNYRGLKLVVYQLLTTENGWCFVCVLENLTSLPERFYTSVRGLDDIPGSRI